MCGVRQLIRKIWLNKEQYKVLFKQFANMARINIIDYKDATGALKSTYDELIEKRGKLSEVLTVQSLHPASIVSHINFYMDIMFSS